MNKDFANQTQSLFPHSAKPFTHAKAEAFARAKATVGKHGKVLTQGFTPSIDMSGVKFFGPLDEVDAQSHPEAPSSVDKDRRAENERVKEARLKTASEKARAERVAQAEAEKIARKKAEEVKRYVRVQTLLAERRAQSIAVRAATASRGWKRQHATGAVAVAVVQKGGVSRKIPASRSSSLAAPTGVNNSNIGNGNGPTVSFDDTEGARKLHVKERHSAIVHFEAALAKF
ncbi:hypothetical protein Z517_03509 [Fonsecaea pedrosoi CBS 271.37]|uniref:Uncharacterized protein n=1 Tax=Fonsecaea pedrosoi CBS 271.37 TaxID=1442368 RepID=A0A0D2HIF6_9EURO|nr:uncharacterized protein Z517_03509 [Fonsecaea pedrosoi CBS 271.37]KIW84259.1 hypothetical protein Z517_03509 [Fonsecaea pedrosoi CBS 271.37]